MAKSKKPATLTVEQAARKLITTLNNWHFPTHGGWESCNLCSRVADLKIALLRTARPLRLAQQSAVETPMKRRPHECGVSNEDLECLGCGEKIGLIKLGHCYYLEGRAALKSSKL